MYLEERVQALEMQIELLQKQLESLQGAGEEQFLTAEHQEKCFSRRKSLLSVITNHYLSHWTFIWKEDRKSP